MNPDRIIKLSAAVGIGLVVVGGVLMYRRHKTGNLGLGKGRFITHRAQQAAVVGAFSDGVMKTELRADPEMPIDQRLATIQDLVHKSVQDPKMRKLALDITSKCPERDGLCEAKAIYQAVKGRVRYTGDIAPIKQGSKGPVEGIDLYQSAWRTWEFRGGDCLPAGTLLMTDHYRFVPIERLDVGTKIWGRDDWTAVKDVWAKGTLPVDVVHLSNGSTFEATSDHKVYAVLDENQTVERILISQLQPDMVLLQPRQPPFKDLSVRRGHNLNQGKLLRVEKIDRAVAEKPVYDISTEDHYVYLPEADVVVSNCDDQSILVATLLALNGIEPRLRVTAETRASDWGHIYPGAILPKYGQGQFVTIDTTLPGNNRFGVEVPFAKNLDFPA